MGHRPTNVVHLSHDHACTAGTRRTPSSCGDSCRRATAPRGDRPAVGSRGARVDHAEPTDPVAGRARRGDVSAVTPLRSPRGSGLRIGEHTACRIRLATRPSRGHARSATVGCGRRPPRRGPGGRPAPRSRRRSSRSAAPRRARSSGGRPPAGSSYAPAQHGKVRARRVRRTAAPLARTGHPRMPPMGHSLRFRPQQRSTSLPSASDGSTSAICSDASNQHGGLIRARGEVEPCGTPFRPTRCTCHTTCHAHSAGMPSTPTLRVETPATVCRRACRSVRRPGTV